MDLLEAKILSWLETFPTKKVWTVQELVRKVHPTPKERETVKAVMTRLGFTYQNKTEGKIVRRKVKGWVRP